MDHQHRILERSPIPYAFRINWLANFYTGTVYRQVKERFGVVRSEFVVLFCLENLGELTAQDVSHVTGRPKPSVSRAVNALVHKGLVGRETDANDARRALLAPTRAGHALYRAAMPLFVAVETAMLSTLGAREREQLDRLLGKLVLRSDGWADAELYEGE